MQHDGNGWVECRCGRSHWGRFGAAGLLLLDSGRVLLQLRAEWVHHGGTWATPGGARDSHETHIEAALRETDEETGINASDIEVLATFASVDHLDWAYHYVLARPRRAGSLRWTLNPEADDLRWVAWDDVDRLQLHPGFASSWPSTRRYLGEGLT